MKVNDKSPVRLYKKEPVVMDYDKTTVYILGALFIVVLFAIAFNFGSENVNFILGGCI